MDATPFDASDPFALAKPTVARDLLVRHGHRLGKSLGQHLLVDRRVLERIVATSQVTAGDVVLEIGPGIGTLTRALAAHAAQVVAVETDRRLEPLLAETVGGLDNVRIVFADALHLGPDDLGSQQLPTRLVANLPYNVAATLVLGLLDRLPSLADATVMVQREVGERMAAQPGSKAYGGYTVKLAARASTRIAFRIGPSAFFPPPRVESVVLRLTRLPSASAQDLAVFDAVVDAAFCQRRKMLRSSLAAGLGVSRESAEEALVAAGIAPNERAETLTGAEFVRLSIACDRRSLVNLRSYPSRHTIS